MFCYYCALYRVSEFGTNFKLVFGVRYLRIISYVGVSVIKALPCFTAHYTREWILVYKSSLSNSKLDNL